MRQISRWLGVPLIVMIRIYQRIFSPWKGNSCRYLPTCSDYGLQALSKYGLFKGTYLLVKRVLSCHPWGGYGNDPVP